MKLYSALLVLLLIMPAQSLAEEKADEKVEATTALSLPVDSVTIYPDGLLSVKSTGSLEVTEGTHDFVVDIPKSASTDSVLFSATNSTIERVVYDGNPTYTVNVSTSGTQRFSLSYLIYNGGSWEPRYDLHLSNDTLLMAANAVVRNLGGENLLGVKLKLVAGMPPRIEPYLESKVALQQANYAGAASEAVPAPAPAPAYVPTRSSELETFYIFELEGRKDLEENKQVGFPLFRDSVPIKRMYTWDASTDESGPAAEELRANNTMQAPWPSGSAMLYRDDEYVSTISIPYTSNGTNASIVLGPSPDLKVGKKLKDYNITEGLKSIAESDGRNHTVKETIERWTYELSVKSNVDREAVLEVSDVRPKEAKLTDISPKPTELTATGMKWRLNLEPREKQVVSYTYMVITTEPIEGSA